MITPTIHHIISQGFRISANARTQEVARCADDVLSAYILHYVTAAEVSAAADGGAIDRAWTALTYIRYMQDVEFATRTGGERKRYDYGDHLTWMEAAKNTAARRLKELEAVRTVNGKPSDVCGIFLKTQFFY